MKEDEFKQYKLALELIAKQREYIDILHNAFSSFCLGSQDVNASREMLGIKVRHEMMAIDIQLKDVYLKS